MPQEPVRDRSPWVLPPLSLLWHWPTQGPISSIPRGPPAPHRELRLHLRGHNLVTFGRTALSAWRKSPQYLPDWVKVQFLRLWKGTCTQPPAPRARMYFPELSACCQPRCSAPCQVPIVRVPCWWHRVWLSQTPPEQGPRLLCLVFFPGMILNDHF